MKWVWTNDLHSDHSICVGSQLRVYWHFPYTTSIAQYRSHKDWKDHIFMFWKLEWLQSAAVPCRKIITCYVPCFPKLDQIISSENVFPLVTKQWSICNSRSPKNASVNINKLKVPLGWGKNRQDCCIAYPVCFFFPSRFISRQCLFIACVLISADLKCLSMIEGI